MEQGPIQNVVLKVSFGASLCENTARFDRKILRAVQHSRSHVEELNGTSLALRDSEL